MSDGVVESLARKFARVLPHLNEKQVRLLMAAEAVELGHGGIAAVARAAGASRSTVRAGIDDLEAGQEPSERVRRPGGGRKPAAEKDPGLLPALWKLVGEHIVGDPIRLLLWTTRSTRDLARELTAAGHKVSHWTVAALLTKEGFSLQGNARVLAGTQHVDRDAQFQHINTTAAAFLAAGDPVISVDTKKKETIGVFARPGVEWRRQGDPRKVLDHDFTTQGEGVAIPYGVYDVGRNTGWVVVGTDHDTASFAVAAIRSWWFEQGRHDYPRARRLLITADGGGSNATRSRVWKAGLALLAAETGLQITVAHLPPGTSKWNKVEHKLFSFISITWRAIPLTSYDVTLNLISSTTTRTGLTVRARLDTGTYPTGIGIDDQHLAALDIRHHDFHGEWNYTLPPDPATTPPPLPTQPNPAKPPTPSRQPLDPHTDPMAHPDLTGMPRQQLLDLTAELHHQPSTDPAPTPRGRGPQLTFQEQVWATVLSRRRLTHQLLAKTFGVSPATIKRAIARTGPRLHQHGTTITPLPKPIRHTVTLSRYYISETLGNDPQHA
jgi:transposase